MAHKLLKQLLVFAAAVLTGCTTNLDYHIVGTGTEVETEIIYETVYEEIEVPVYIEVEVPADPGLIWVDSFIQPMSGRWCRYSLGYRHFRLDVSL